MNERIAKRFAKLKAEKRSGLVTFTMAFDPDYTTSLDILKALPENGADIVELGMPFSDPMADGPSVANAGKRALKAGAKLTAILDMVKTFRESDTETPLILMGYVNPLLHFGIDKFFEQAKASGVDGLIIVDLPPEEDDDFFAKAKEYQIDLIKLITPTTDEKRLQTILAKASGFLYYVSVAGITGSLSASAESVEAALALFKKHTDLPIVVGFGIKTAEQVAAISHVADGVVVGSALVNHIADNENDVNKAKTALLELTGVLARKL